MTSAFADSATPQKLMTSRQPSRLRQVHSLAPEPVAEEGTRSRSLALVDVAGSLSFEIGDEVVSYAEAISHENSDELFGDTGLLAKFYTIGQDKLDYLSSLDGDLADALQHWQLECRTWDLVQRLYLERTKSPPSLPIDTEEFSNYALEQLFYDTDNAAAESKIVLDWLRDGSSVESPLQIRGNRWFYTKEKIKSKERMGQVQDDPYIVSSLDPDAPTRQGKRIDDRDAEFERTLMKSMFSHIRAGEFQEAADIARLTGNHWRAASLQGCVECRDSDADGGVSEGTPRKALWRRMCFALSRQTTIDAYERAMYGALCGDLASVLPVCTTWEDRMWAHFNAMNQSKVEAYLRTFGRVQLSHEFPISNFEHSAPHAVLDGLMQTEDARLQLEAKLPLRIIQARLITNQVDVLLHDMHQQLSSIKEGGGANAAALPHVLRFVTHLILVLRQLNLDIPEVSTNSIIQAYVELLASANQGTIVPLYAAQLPTEHSQECLARYWSTVTDEDDRKGQLQLAFYYKIDIEPTILRSIECVLQETLQFLPSKGPIGNVSDEISLEEERSIRALEWVKLHEFSRGEPVILGNTLFRGFLLAGHISSAKTLVARLPDTLLISDEVMLQDDDNRALTAEDEARMRNAIEYVGYCTLTRALSRYEDWKLLLGERSQEINGRRDPVGLKQWKIDVARLESECITLLREVLHGNWCNADELGIPENDRVYAEMRSLRNTYVPAVVLKLHGVFSAHKERDVSAAMALAVLVAQDLAEPMKASGLLPTYVAELSMLGSHLI